MIELSKHIESLLMDNDCVIVPELGGFIAHYQPARYEENEGVFLPPIRTVGFNPLLTMNDGLLVQSYMHAYHTDYSDASRMISETVDKMLEQVYVDGVVELHQVGTLNYNIHGLFEFTPNERGISSPSLYGLDSFCMQRLSEKKADEQKVVPMQVHKTQTKPIHNSHLNLQWLGNAVAAAIAIIMFFVFSAPVENTYVDEGCYASLGTDCFFDAIRSHSMATALSKDVERIDNTQHIVKREVKPIVVKTEKIAPVSNAEKVTPTPKVEKVSPIVPSAPIYHIIVASLTTSKDAEQMMLTYKQKGYNDVRIVEGNGRFRISLYNYSERSEANKKLEELKLEDAYKSAWLLTSKPIK